MATSDKTNNLIVSDRRVFARAKSPIDAQRITSGHPWADRSGVPTSIGKEDHRTRPTVAKKTVVDVVRQRVDQQLPSAVSLKFQTVQTNVRPINEFTIEEERIRLASIAGPLRIHAGVASRRDLEPSVARQLSTGTHAVKFIRIEPIFGFTGLVIFSTNKKGSRDTAPAVFLPDEGPYDAVLLPDEELYGFSDEVGGISLKVLEIVV